MNHFESDHKEPLIIVNKKKMLPQQDHSISDHIINSSETCVNHQVEQTKLPSPIIDNTIIDMENNNLNNNNNSNSYYNLEEPSTSTTKISDTINYKELYEKEMEKNKLLSTQLNIINLGKQDEIEMINVIENELQSENINLKFIKYKFSKLKELYSEQSNTNSIILNDYSQHELDKFETEIQKRIETHSLNLQFRIQKLEKQLDFVMYNQKFSSSNNCSKCNDLQERSAMIIQKAFRSFRLKKRMRIVLPQYDIITQRNALISEIVQTEQTYVKSLTLVQRLYIDPLRNSDNDMMRFNLRINEIQKIFNNLSTILSMHRIFLINLEQKLKEWPKVYIGEIFMNQSFFFLFYVEYVNGYNESSNTLRELRAKNKEFNSFLNETKKHRECKGLSLESFLILPIQRYVINYYYLEFLIT